MDAPRIILAFGWAALMFLYLLGDVLRIFAGHYRPGRIEGQPTQPWMWLVPAAFMIIPIAMMLLSLLLPATVLLWTTLLACVGLVVFNAIALPYEGLYDNVLIVVGWVLNGSLAWQAWVGWRTDPGLRDRDGVRAPRGSGW